MLDWLIENVDLLNLIASWAMVAIWVVYLQVFLRSFRRQTLPKIVINRAAGSTLDASCFVSNMSPDAIYIESVIVEVACGERKFSSAVTEIDLRTEDDNSLDPKQRTFQGPLASAAYTSLGTFQHLVGTLSRHTGCDIDELQTAGLPLFIDISILADYASEKLLIGARRRFRATWEDGQWKLVGETPETRQIRSHRERRQISRSACAGDRAE